MDTKTPSNAVKADRKEYRAADAIIEQLEQQIISGALPNGSTLPAERDLMRQYLASRTVVREAITALSSRGLIENRPRFRPVVRKPDFQNMLNAIDSSMKHLLSQNAGVKNLYESRIFVERMLVRDAATSARKSDVENLTIALSNNKKAIKNSPEFYATDMAFHAVLYRIPDNPIFPALHNSYTTWLEPIWMKMPRSTERNLMNYLSHEAIYDAILARDPNNAEAALVRHLNAAWEYVRVTFDDNE